MRASEELSFARLCHEELSREKVREGIGLLEEKRLHSVLKRWICDDFETHEQKVPGRGEKSRKFVADVLTKSGEIFEIQTADLYPMKKKIEFYMSETDHPVTVVETETNGPVLLVIKESYGNPLISWLTGHYSKIILIDPREYFALNDDIDLAAFAQEQNVSQCLIVNYPMMLGSEGYIGHLQNLSN